MWIIFLIFFSFSLFGQEQEQASKELSFNEEQFSFALPEQSIANPFSDAESPLSPQLTMHKKSPFLAMSAGLVPGLGHAYLGDYKTAGKLLGATALGASAALLSPSAVEGHDLGLATIHLWFYSLYATYRDVRTLNGIEHSHYAMPNERLSDLALAPLRWSVLKKPEVWGGLLGAYATAVAVGVLSKTFSFQKKASLVMQGGSTPLVAWPVGIGEESLFRGFLQPALAESLTPWGGIALSSLLFGAAHIPNANELHGREKKDYYAFSLPFITAMGSYLGWMAYKNSSLQESVALHVWYDFFIFAAEAATSNLACTRPTHFSFSFSF